jgi:CDP-glycerol glycerophosphotransferase
LALIESAQVFPKLERITYYKRERNDPISNPSLNQSPITERVQEVITTFKNQKAHFNLESIHSYLDNFLLSFYRRYALVLTEENQSFSEWFEPLATALEMIRKDKIHSQPAHIRREIRYLLNRQQAKFKQALKLRGEILDLKGALKGRTGLKKYVYKKIFLKMPLKQKHIVFESFLGKNYSDSPRNIYEYITQNHPDYQCIWVFNDKNKKVPGKAKIVKRFSLGYYYYLAVSKYWVNNMRQPLHLVKREGNVFLETWHGTPLKKLVFDMKDVHSANPRYKRDFYLQSRAWDYLISPNGYSSEIFRRAFKFDKEMLEFGYPRNDLLYAPDREERAKKIKRSLSIPEDKKVVLYAPTWRDDDYYQPGKYKFNLKLDLKKMQERLGEQYVVALRMHYFIADDLNVDGLEGFAFNLSKYDDISELYLISDILITDYSSVFFDYANLKRPILFFTYDLDKYRDQLRGFYLDFENEAPGPLLRESDDVIEAIDNINQVSEDYSSKYIEFYEKFCSWHDGKSTEKVVKRVFLGE